MTTKRQRLYPSQVCFVVDDVKASATECAERFGWGPFHQFTAEVPDASYRDWRGAKVTDVALGMAGRVQVELIHVHEGRDAVAAYQEQYGSGFQHLGIGCRDRDAAVSELEAGGATLNEQTEYGGIRIAFVDVPTGPAMFELLQPTGEGGAEPELARRDAKPQREALALDRATIVTGDMDAALSFYASAFRWEDARAERQTLRYGGATTSCRRVLGKAGALEIELIEPSADGDDPYARHLRRGEHGLVHAGGLASREVTPGASIECAWVEAEESFGLYAGPGGEGSVQFRSATTSPPYG